jgi:hypothetical protein
VDRASLVGVKVALLEACWAHAGSGGSDFTVRGVINNFRGRVIKE